jgi:hypothetical protein
LRPRNRIAAFCLALLYLGGCTSTETPAPRVASPSTSHPSATPAGGQRTFTFGFLGEPATLDPYSPLASDLTYALLRPLYPSLYRLLPDGSAEPSLAASLQKNGNQTEIELIDARWSNGRAITARDVVASVERARAPSGFAGVQSARATGKRTIVLNGDVDELDLATAAFVLPGGRSRPGLSGGPYRLVRREPGLRFVYASNPRWHGAAPTVPRLEVQFYEFAATMRTRLKNEKLDAAAIPSTVNLAERLDAADLQHDSALGWESIHLEFSPGALTVEEQRGVDTLIDRAALAEGFIRDDGRVVRRALSGRKDLPASLSLAIPAGDELLSLIQRALQFRFDEANVTVDLVETDAKTFYGPWRTDSPADAALVRSSGAPGQSLEAFPLFEVATYLVWRSGVTGLMVNPTFDGPLWNVEEWGSPPDGIVR